MGQWLSEHYNWVLGLLALAIWLAIPIWYMSGSGMITEWLQRRRDRRKRQD
jgi:hypothetical protein